MSDCLKSYNERACKACAQYKTCHKKKHEYDNYMVFYIPVGRYDDFIGGEKVPIYAKPSNSRVRITEKWHYVEKINGKVRLLI